MASPLLSDREELIAIAAWRRVLQDRRDGVTREPAEYASLFPEAVDFVRSEIGNGPRGVAGLAAEGVVGHYRLLRCLGQGGQAEVWLAEDTALAERHVALKLFALTGPGASATALRLRQEVEVAVRVAVPGVCPIHDTGSDGDFAWIAMRHVDGATLAQVLASEPGAATKTQLPQRLAWLEAVARTMHAVHGHGVVHRDLKPSNVMLEHGGGPVILDFGVAKAFADREGLTATGLPVGTPAYMAPEQIQGTAPVGPAADIWALGAMLFECAVGERPFAAATPFDLQRAIVDGPHGAARAWRRQIGKDLAVVIDTALAKQPAQRYRSAIDFAEDLARVQAWRPVLAQRPGVWTHLVRFAQRRPAVAALLAMLFATITAALVVAVVLLGEKDRELQRADRAQRFVFHLSDGSRLEQLRRELDDELAIESSRLPQFESWWGRASELIDRLPQHETFLVDLQAQALPRSDDEPEMQAVRRTQQAQLEWALGRQRDYHLPAHQQQIEAALAAGDTDGADVLRSAVLTADTLVADAQRALAAPAGRRFAEPDLQFMHNQVAELVHSLRQFALIRPGDFTRKAGHWLWGKAQVVRAQSLDDHKVEWQAAIDRIAAPDGRYRGLRLEPQEGLVPLGPDPRSGLEEFAHVSTGRVPTRDPATGLLSAEPDAALVLVLLPGGVARVGALRPPARGMEPRGFVLPPPADVPLDPFFLGKYEVTQHQWWEIMYRWPSTRHQDGPPLERVPAETIDSALAERYARRLGMALPSEAQWEYACRAGTETAFWFGDDPSQMSTYGNVYEENPRPGDAPADGYLSPAPVGIYPANPFGLHDMHGNVAEWTADAGVPPDVPFVGPAGLRKVTGLQGRVVRGGSYDELARHAQSWWRPFEPQRHELKTVGLRVARAIR